MCGIAGYEGPLTCDNVTVLARQPGEEGCVAKPQLRPSCLFASLPGRAAYGAGDHNPWQRARKEALTWPNAAAHCPWRALRLPALAEITDREREVLTLIGLGMSNDEIAAKLFVSMSTVKAHVGRLVAKLGARYRAHLVIAAYSARLVGDR